MHARVVKKQGDKKRLTLNITHVVAVDGDARLSRAIDILLRAATGELEGSINAKKQEPPQCSRPEKVAD